MDLTRIAKSLVIMLLGASLAWAYSSGPPDGYTGGPEELNCTVTCHSTFPLNSGSGLLTISAPVSYSGGDTLDLRVDLAQTGQRRWGFELTVLNSANQPVGNVIVTDPARTQKSTSGGGRQYIKQTSAGTDNGTLNASPGWSFRWAAPSAGAGPVTFYAAGNAANGNGANTFDYIYTTAKAVTEAPVSVSEDGHGPESFELVGNFPNPFNPSTTIRFSLNRNAAGAATLEVFDPIGRLVRTLARHGFLAPGEHAARWDGRDDRGRPVASGVYFCRLSTRGGVQTHPMTLLR